jgi:hypothetical protein
MKHEDIQFWAIQLNFVIANSCKNIFPIFGALHPQEHEDIYRNCCAFFIVGRFKEHGSGR